MKIIQAQPQDLVDILFLLKQCVKDMNSKGFKHWNSAHPSPELIKNDIEKGTLYLYTDLGIVQGMINLSDEIPEEYKDIKWKLENEKILYVKRFAIHPLWQEANIGEQLIGFAENFAKEHNFKGVRLDVLDSYPLNEKFFESKDYGKAGTFHSDFQKIPYACFEKGL
ncbi:MAG: GNAT family N-acetyltransferase [Bacteroidales bacterium]|nr:GNAT family N-acetyltransferase [Bacteroidales bacterium]